MSDTFVLFATNENGTFTDPDSVSSALSDSLQAPFAYDDVFVYSHGWWTTADDAMSLYGKFVVGFKKTLHSIWNILPQQPKSSFGIGLHWPSTVDENMSGLSIPAQALSYYQMGERGQQIGGSGLYAALSTMIQARLATQNRTPFKLIMIGHSFGCRVICSALQRLAAEVSKISTNTETRNFVQNLDMRLVLLEPAFKNTELDRDGNYDKLADSFPSLKVLVTTSQLDRALNFWFPLAENLHNIVNFRGVNAVALGGGIGPLQTIPLHIHEQQPQASTLSTGGGPTPSTWTNFGRTLPISVVAVGPGYTPPQINLRDGERIALADLTPIHIANLEAKAPGTRSEWTWSSTGGSHSDICCPEVYQLIAEFIFN